MTAPAHRDTLRAGESLRPGESLTCASGKYTFVHQIDGNLVLYRNEDQGSIWSTATTADAGTLVMQPADGNLVLYDGDGTPRWATHAYGQDNRLVMQDDSNLVVYTPADRPVWDIGLGPVRGPAARGDTIQPGEVLHPGGSITSADGSHSLIYQGDGNLVLYRNGDRHALWSAGTQVMRGTLVLQASDGNLVLYDDDMRAAWASYVMGAGNRITLHADGELVVHGSTGRYAIAPLHRVSVVLLGFRCLRQTWDSAIQDDGAGDEIFLRADVGGSHGTQLLPARQLRTPVHGQGRMVVPGVGALAIPGRVEVGGASSLGGIRTGDRWPWPDPVDPGRPVHRPDAAGRGALPMVLWDWTGPAGALAGSIVVSPSVWEYDHGTPLDTGWGDAIAQSVADIAREAAVAGGVLTAAFPALAPLAGVGAAMVAAAQLGPTLLRTAKDILGEAGDRPVGQVKHDDGSRTFDPAVFALDLAAAATAAHTDTGAGPGVWTATFTDSAALGGGQYELYVGVRYEPA